MELPNDSTANPNDELEELLILTGINILEERAQAGDELSGELLELTEARLEEFLRPSLNHEERMKQIGADIGSTMEKLEARSEDA